MTDPPVIDLTDPNAPTMDPPRIDPQAVPLDPRLTSTIRIFEPVALDVDYVEINVPPELLARMSRMTMNIGSRLRPKIDKPSVGYCRKYESTSCKSRGHMMSYTL